MVLMVFAYLTLDQAKIVIKRLALVIKLEKVTFLTMRKK
jgi:hypothetical protein